jgi:hypothetical protein
MRNFIKLRLLRLIQLKETGMDVVALYSASSKLACTEYDHRKAPGRIVNN